LAITFLEITLLDKGGSQPGFGITTPDSFSLLGEIKTAAEAIAFINACLENGG
jgi:hypothetical protein